MTTADAAAPAPVGRPRLIVAVVLCGTVVGPLNSTMSAVALPGMAEHFAVSSASMSWLVTAYLIATAALQPVAGKLGDRVGRRPIMLLGFALAFVSSALAVIAPALWMLILCRVGQAIAGALVAPNAMALMRATASPERVGRAFGIVGAVMPLAAAVGPVIGGGLVALGSWPAIFLVNLPLTGAALLLGWWVIPRGAERGNAPRFDVLGGVWLSVLLVGLTLMLDLGPRGGAAILAWVALAAAAGAFVLYESRLEGPMLQPRLFAVRSFASASAGIALSNLAFYVTLLALPLLLHAEGRTELTIGLVLGALTVASAPVAVLGGRLVDKVGPRRPAAAGLGVMTAGLLLLAVGASSWPPVALAVCLAVLGAGVGLSMTPFQLGALHDVADSDTGTATGVFFASRYLGSILGSALLAGPLEPSSPDGFVVLFVVLVAVAILGTIVSLLLPDAPPRDATARR